MTKRMLIDATHAEETRVVVLDGNRLEDFDVEVASKKQLKGNIYLAKVIRVEPSLQAAFVEYGGGRHGFLAFSEIHPDYYQIPVADRQRLLALQAEEARAAEAEEDEAVERETRASRPAEAAEPPILAATQPALAAPTRARPIAAESPAPEVDADPDRLDEADPAPLAENPSPEPPRDAAPGAPPPPLAETADGAAEPAPAAADAPPDAPPDAPGDDPGPGSSRAQAAAIARDEVFGPELGVGPEGAAQADVDTADVDTADVDTADVDTEGAAPADTAAADGGPEETARPGTAPEPDAPTPAEAEQVTSTGEEPPEPAPDARADGRAEAEPEPEADASAGLDELAPEPDLVPGAFDIPDAEQPPPETIGGGDGAVDDAASDEARVRRTSRLLRSYRIQEVIHRRQIMLVQVVKEERGTKGAALTTYISLAGRFSVLMPNSPRGGGISRKITSAADRKRLREVTTELNLPEGMGLIVRTAGANRPKPEIKRDCEYLMRLWDDIREHTFRSIAPALIYEEASLIKRAIRDVYSRDIDEIVVDGEEGWRAAHDFMRMLMPSHARKVQLWRGGAEGQGAGPPGQPGQSLFSKYQVEAQLDAMTLPTVPLRSGGYLVINQTEALVAIDVNSGRSTRERNIEETALRTNLEAADEAARQLRLRDLAGLIVIDFIDMESRKHNAAVERRLKDALRIDRARIQVGSISHFGLLEMSRQRLRPSLAETTFEPCPHCNGTGHVRGVESSAIHVLRAVEEEGGKQRAAVVMVHAAGPVVMYLLNHKRDRLADIEQRFSMRVQFAIDDQLLPGQSRIDKVRGREEIPIRPASSLPVVPAAPVDLAEEDDDEDEVDEAEERDASAAAVGAGGAEAAAGAAEEAERRRRRRRRRRGGRRDEPAGAAGTAEAADEAALAAESDPSDAVPDTESGADTAPVGSVEPADPDRPETEPADAATALAGPAASDDQPSIDPSELDENGLPRAGRRRGRRGGRRRRRDGEDEAAPDAELSAAAAPTPTPAPAYLGPTPADPFGGGFDIFDVLDAVGALPPARQVTHEPEPEPEPAPTPESAEAALAPRAEPFAAVAAGGPEPAGIAATTAPDAPTSEAAESSAPASDLAVSDLPLPASPALEVESGKPGTIAPEEPDAAEPYVAEPIQPVLIGAGDAPPAERKRGWWRR